MRKKEKDRDWGKKRRGGRLPKYYHFIFKIKKFFLEIGEIFFEIYVDFGWNKESIIKFRTIKDEDFNFEIKQSTETKEKIKINETFEFRIKVPTCKFEDKKFEIEFNFENIMNLKVPKEYFKLNRITVNFKIIF